jgi:hypothetical protein
MSSVGEQSEDVVPTRPVKESLWEMAALSLVACLLTGAIIGFAAPPSSAAAARAYLTRCTEIGAVVIDHIGWEFGVVVPVLLGFYVLVLGGRQSLGQRRTAAVRRNLSMAAEMLTASLAPAVVLSFLATLADYRRGGALVAAVPATVLTVFLAAQLGCFMAFDDDERLAAARRNRAWVRQRLAAVRMRSRRPVAVVLTGNLLVGTALSACLYVVLGGPPSSFASTSALAAVVSALGVHGGFGLVRDRFTAKTSFERATGYLLLGMLTAAVAALALFLLTNEASVEGISIAFGFALMLLSAILPLRSGASSLARDWTLRGAAARSVAVRLTKRYVRATSEISAAEGIRA